MSAQNSRSIVTQEKLAPLSSGIPRIIHQSWKTSELPSRFKTWQKSWKKHFPTWEYKLWTDAENDKLVREKFPQYYSLFKNFKQHIFRVDTVRYLYMYEYGGIYSDLDGECLRPFEHLLDRPLVFGGMNGQGNDILHTYVQNSMMASAPRQPFWIELVERIKLKSAKPDSAEATTGPYVLMEVLREHVRANDTAVRIYDGKYFNPWSWIEGAPAVCKDLNRMTLKEIDLCRQHFVKNNAYVVQYHTQVWRNGKPRK